MDPDFVATLTTIHCAAPRILFALGVDERTNEQLRSVGSDRASASDRSQLGAVVRWAPFSDRLIDLPARLDHVTYI